MGRKVEELAPNLRSFPIGSYLIFYRPVEDGIELIRVLHGARDITPEYFAEKLIHANAIIATIERRLPIERRRAVEHLSFIQNPRKTG